jgi:GDP/UDP-N,N'-diacetylbacillosamine 2-epimerase (hydrolysing)
LDSPKKICVITGTRADYGLLRLVMEGILDSNLLDLQLISTGMHHSQEFGLTYKEIEKDGFTIDSKVEMLLSGDTPSAISKSMGLAMISFAESFDKLSPDILLVLGDRFEIMAGVTAAMIYRIPIAHIHGGESTLGATDEAIRHSITKMAWWHFVAADEYQKRVTQMGEDPKRVFNTGGLGVDAIKKCQLLTKEDLLETFGIRFGKKNLLITFHPVTLEKDSSEKHFKALLNVLYELNDTYQIFTLPNADTDSRVIINMINDYVNNKKNSIAFASMGQKKYLSTLKFVDGVVGNSSSGLTEAPSFKIGTINIGDRQTGRLKSKSVIDCAPTEGAIKKAVNTLYSKEFQKSLSLVKNPYGEGNSAEKIVNILSQTKIPFELKKRFYDL